MPRQLHVAQTVVGDLSGHSSGVTTRRYTHGTERAKREAVEAARSRMRLEESEGAVRALAFKNR